MSFKMLWNKRTRMIRVHNKMPDHLLAVLNSISRYTVKDLSRVCIYMSAYVCDF